MPTGRETHLTGYTGEHLVAAELGRRHYMATPFAGNVPLFDLLVADADCRAIPIQVKTIRRGAWQFSIDKFLDIEMDGDVQRVRGKKALPKSELVCVFVRLRDEREVGTQDEFFILQLKDLQEYFYETTPAERQRPRNPRSMHAAIWPENLENFRDNWELIAAVLKESNPDV